MRLFVDATELTDSEAQDLQDFLESESLIESVSLGYYSTETGRVAPPDAMGLLTIHAAAEPLLLAVNFTKEHWGAIVGVVNAAGTLVKGYAWLAKRLHEFYRKRESRFDLLPLYGPDEHLIKMVRVPKKPRGLDSDKRAK